MHKFGTPTTHELGRMRASIAIKQKAEEKFSPAAVLFLS
jgi:hypothetical protein